MRILMLDLDTLRPDHLHCYGYERNTSPTLDKICDDAMRFDNYYCSDAPCLPSRAALCTGTFGIHNGAVNHGGAAADVRLVGAKRGFHDQTLENNLFFTLRRAGFKATTISSFAERHSSYWFNAGFHEIINCGKRGDERGDEVINLALEWVNKNAQEDNWFLHINMWDPHTPFRSPMAFGNPFEEEPIPAWVTQEVFERHLKHVGPHSLLELGMYSDGHPEEYPRQLGKATTMEELKQVFDGYDCGIRYMDEQIGRLVDLLKQKGIYDDLAIIITSDHGENIGELGIYSEHATADQITTRIPMIIKWDKKGVDKGLHYSLDLAPTLSELLNVAPCENWDGKSYAKTITAQAETGREYLVLSQCSHVCQRSVRFDDYIYIRTYHDGYHLFPDEMLFDIQSDYHEQNNLAEARPDICGKACRYLAQWHSDMMKTAATPIDPLWVVLSEGGPYHAKGSLPAYCERLKKTGRAEGAKALKMRHPREFE